MKKLFVNYLPDSPYISPVVHLKDDNKPIKFHDVQAYYSFIDGLDFDLVSPNKAICVTVDVEMAIDLTLNFHTYIYSSPELGIITVLEPSLKLPSIDYLMDCEGRIPSDPKIRNIKPGINLAEAFPLMNISQLMSLFYPTLVDNKNAEPGLFLTKRFLDGLAVAGFVKKLMPLSFTTEIKEADPAEMKDFLGSIEYIGKAVIQTAMPLKGKDGKWTAQREIGYHRGVFKATKESAESLGIDILIIWHLNNVRHEIFFKIEHDGQKNTIKQLDLITQAPLQTPSAYMLVKACLVDVFKDAGFVIENEGSGAVFTDGSFAKALSGLSKTLDDAWKKTAESVKLFFTEIKQQNRTLYFEVSERPSVAYKKTLSRTDSDTSCGWVLDLELEYDGTFLGRLCFNVSVAGETTESNFIIGFDKLDKVLIANGQLNWPAVDVDNEHILIKEAKVYLPDLIKGVKFELIE